MKKYIFGSVLGVVAVGTVIACNGLVNSDPLPRPEGPCDIYAAGGAPCVAAHSTTRALYASYEGPLYQVMRQSDGKVLDINVVKASGTDAGGYANAAAQDEFCKDTYCWITIIYDQSPKENHLYQAPRGTFSGGAMGGYNNIPVADWAPVNVMGHKVYGVFIVPGSGMRQNDPVGTAVDDQAQGQYWVINGLHYNNGCCFDYGNAEIDSKDDGDGTMETTYYGNTTGWYYGDAPGPWIMTDQENNLVGCVNEDPNDKYCVGLDSISWRFVTATADGEPHHWRSMGGNAQEGQLKTYYDGGRIKNDRNSYDPMRKQGAILLGNGGDNSVASAGTFYEGAMTAAGTFPSAETNQAIQANVVAAQYKEATVEMFPSLNDGRPSNIQTFAPASTQTSVVRFVNNSGEAISDLVLSVEAPKGWKAVAKGSSSKQMKVGYTVEPGQVVVAEFDVTSSSASFNGDMVASASWNKGAAKEIAHLKVRSADPVKINEFSVSDSFIELYNDSDKAVDLSGWKLSQHTLHLPAFSDVTFPAGSKIAPKSFFVLGLANSGLAVDAAKGESTIYVRSIEGISAGDEILIGGEKKTVKAVAGPQGPNMAMMGGSTNRMSAAGAGYPTTIWQPLPSGRDNGHHIEIPVGSTNIPVASVNGFQVGQKMAIGYGTDIPAVSLSKEKYEVVTITEVGKPASMGWLSMDAKPGDTNIKVSNTANISVGDKIRLDINSEGHGVEWVTVTKVGTASARNTLAGPLKPGEDAGTGLDIAEPLKFAHASNLPYSVDGTGITFEPATKHVHYSNEPVLALAYSIELDSPLASAHAIDEAVIDAASKAGYQGSVAADLVYGGPALSATAGNMVLRDAKGNVVDALNYGLVVDPWAAQGYQADSGAGQPGNFAPVPAPRRMPQAGASSAATALSTGRYPDGADQNDTKNDFQVHRTSNIMAAASAGDKNVKVASVNGFKAGSMVVIGTGAAAQTVKVESVGTAGATVLSAGAGAGSQVLNVMSAQNFTVGQEIVIGDEHAVVASVVIPRGWRLQGAAAQNKINLAAPLKQSHRAAEAVAGTGITLAEPLNAAVTVGTPMVSGCPTPGSANIY